MVKLLMLIVFKLLCNININKNRDKSSSSFFRQILFTPSLNDHIAVFLIATMCNCDLCKMFLGLNFYMQEKRGILKRMAVQIMAWQVPGPFLGWVLTVSMHLFTYK